MNITDKGIRINLPFPPCSHRREPEVTECSLRLYNTYVDYRCVASYESDYLRNFEGIWKETKTDYRWTRLRKDIASVTLYYDNPESFWVLEIEFSGCAESTGWYYHDANDAMDAYKTLKEYHILQI